MNNTLLKFLTIPVICLTLLSCKHKDTDVKNELLVNTINVYYNVVQLDWNTNTFIHNENTIYIPEKWGFEIAGQRSKFVNRNPHDIMFSYYIYKVITYGGTEYYRTEFKELVYKKPQEKKSIFEISTVGLDIDSKLLVKDELVNDYG